MTDEVAQTIEVVVPNTPRVRYNCPKCRRWRKHAVYIRGVFEVLVCTKPTCGNHLYFTAPKYRKDAVKE